VVVVGVSGLSTKEGGACEVDDTLEVSLRNQAMIKDQNGNAFQPYMGGHYIRAPKQRHQYEVAMLHKQDACDCVCGLTSV
jgi:hypothetical protein